MAGTKEDLQAITQKYLPERCLIDIKLDLERGNLRNAQMYLLGAFDMASDLRFISDVEAAEAHEQIEL